MLNIFSKGVFAIFLVLISYSLPARTSLDIAFITDPQEKENKFNSQDMCIIFFNDLPEQSF